MKMKIGKLDAMKKISSKKDGKTDKFVLGMEG